MRKVFSTLLLYLFLAINVAGGPAHAQEAYYFIQHWVTGQINDAVPGPPPPERDAAGKTLIAGLGVAPAAWQQPLLEPLPADGGYLFDMNDVTQNWNVAGQPDSISIATQSEGGFGAGPETAPLNAASIQTIDAFSLVADGGITGFELALRLFLQGYFDPTGPGMTSSPTVVVQARRTAAPDGVAGGSGVAVVDVGPPVEITLGTDGRGTALWSGVPVGNAYLVIRHRASPAVEPGANHLPIITEAAVSIPESGSLAVNFSNPAAGALTNAFTPTGAISALRTAGVGGVDYRLLRAGDTDANLLVNSGDYSLWRGVWQGGPAPLALVDMDGNGIINSADYSLWRGTWQEFSSQNNFNHGYVP